jgi:hypothetical protein
MGRKISRKRIMNLLKLWTLKRHNRKRSVKWPEPQPVKNTNKSNVKMKPSNEKNLQLQVKTPRHCSAHRMGEMEKKEEEGRRSRSSIDRLNHEDGRLHPQQCAGLATTASNNTNRTNAHLPFSEKEDTKAPSPASLGAIQRDTPRRMDAATEEEVAADTTTQGEEEIVEGTTIRQSSRPSYHESCNY